MDASITSGAEISLIGVSVVFLALISLMVAVSVISRIFTPGPTAKPAPAVPPVLETVSDTSHSAEVPNALGAIALAAYGYHRRRSQRTRIEPVSTQWEIAGRVRQLARSDNRN